MLRSILLLGVLTTSACALNHPSFGWNDGPPADDGAIGFDARPEAVVDGPVIDMEVPDDGPPMDMVTPDDGPPMDMEVPDDGPPMDMVTPDDGPPIDAEVPCPAGQMRCGEACADLTSDNMHCGRCANPCGAAQSCVAGTCACASGTGDCDGNPANGCETTLAASAAHCGRCGNACGAGQACAAGVCACAMGAGDCDGNPANGCETDLATSTAHCGRCAGACAARPNSTPACIGGGCSPVCNAGFADCDGMEANGCEVNTATSANHCGGCGRVCQVRPNGSSACVGGACVLTCNNPYGDCNMMEADGCEANGGTSPMHCGGCNRPCPAGMGCQNSMCITTCGPRTSCGSTCVDTQVDVNHCGSCTTVCATGQACLMGRCACPTGQTVCSGACTNTQTDLRNCGACGVVCPAGGSCSSGRCQCPTGRTACGGRCVDTLWDTTHCGGCDRPCAPDRCFFGACLCGNRGNRCCSIGTACVAGLTCRSGQCT